MADAILFLCGSMQHFYYLNLEEFFYVPLKGIAENDAPNVAVTSAVRFWTSICPTIEIWTASSAAGW